MGEAATANAVAAFLFPGKVFCTGLLDGMSRRRLPVLNEPIGALRHQTSPAHGTQIAKRAASSR
jgi:hypothetical protein